MKAKIPRSLLVAAALLGASSALSAREAAKEDQAFSDRIISAIQKMDYDSFIADGDMAFQKLKKEQFEAVAAQLAPRFKAGFEINYLGDLNQRGYHVTLWKLSFKDGKDDALATLSIKEGKIGGYWIK